MSKDNAVTVKNVFKNYGETEALRDLSLDFPRGELTSLLGPSGCGKTTLLKIIAGLLPATSGEVIVNGQIVKEPGPDRAFVFQDFALLPWASVIRNVGFGLELRGVAKSERESIAAKYIGDVGLKGFENSFPHELSGGMRQRVGLARALSVDSQVWMSHGDTIKEVPEHYKIFASTEKVEVAGYVIEGEQTFGVQFHPEVYHSTEGKILIKNFVVDICGCSGDWTPDSFVDETCRQLKEKVGEGH